MLLCVSYCARSMRDKVIALKEEWDREEDRLFGPGTANVFGLLLRFQTVLFERADIAHLWILDLQSNH